MELLLKAGNTPSGVGISYEDGDLMAFSGCCGARIVWVWGEEKWTCKDCHKVTHQCDEGSSLWQTIESKHADPTHGLYRWLESWTGIPKDEFEVTIDA